MNNVIYLEVEGTGCLARVTEIPNRQHNMFKLTFQNNYENVFFTDVETGRWVEEDMGFTALAQEVGKQIKNFMKNPFHVPKLLTWHKQIINGNLFCFGFFNYKKGSNKLYEIYNINKKYMYTLVDMDNDEWQILGNPAMAVGKLDPVFVNCVINTLPLYTARVKYNSR